MCYHDVGQGGVAWFVESQVSCDHGRHFHLDALETTINLSCHQHVTAFLQDGRCKRRLKQTTFYKPTATGSLSLCFVTGCHCNMYPYSVKVMFLLFWYWVSLEFLPMLCTAVCPNVMSLVVIATCPRVLSP